jgi:penicillin-binding protein 2
LSGYFDDREPKELRARGYIVAIAIASVFFMLMVRLWYLQVKEAERYRALSMTNSIRLIKSPAPRGVVSDRNGDKVVDNRPGFDLYMVPEDIRDWTKTKGLLLSLASIEPATIDEKLKRSKARPAFQAIKLKEDLSWDETVRIESYKFEMPGVMLDVAPKRSYLYGEATAHLIGYIGEISEKELSEMSGTRRYSPGDLMGKYGVEKSFEGDLRGSDGGKEIEVDAVGRKIRELNWIAPEPGNNLRLSIDLKTQVSAYLALKGRAGAVVAIEPKTGDVLAMVSTPGFDPNVLSAGVSADEWKEIIENPFDVLTNRAIQGQYPPASTFKPLHAAAALQERVITPKTMIYSGPAFRYAGRDYRDWKEEGHGTINVHRAIVESSDTFFYQVGLKLGVDRLARYSKGFGLGAKTDVALINEKPGLVPSSEWKKKAFGAKWYEGETISVAVGQGYMLATPLQLANAYAAIANGGSLFTPVLVKEVTSPDGTVLRQYPSRIRARLAVSGENLSMVKEALRGVVNEQGGTAYFLSNSGLDIAGKTGTAQVRKLTHRTKNIEGIAYKNRDHAWFAGFAPYNDPKIAVAVIVEHGGFGSSAAAPVAREVFRAFLGEPPPVEYYKEGQEGPGIEKTSAGSGPQALISD